MSPVLLLLLLTSLAGIGQTEEDDPIDSPSDDEEVTPTDPYSEVTSPSEDDTDGGLLDPDFKSNYNETLEEEGLSPTIILVPVVLVVVIIGMIVCGIAMSRKWNQKMATSDGIDDPYLQASSAEKVPMPMFDDDIPSVLELEMEDMDQWVERRGGCL
ncbi:unnamed protein product [Merluccius merluccius]